MTRDDTVAVLVADRPGAAIDPARRAAAVAFAERLRVAVGGYGRRIAPARAVRPEALPDACAPLAGAVLLGFDDAELERLPVLDVPVVAIDSYAREPWFPIVRSDDRDGGRRAAQHLLALGHRSIAFAAPADDDSRLLAERRHGFAEALEAAGVIPRTLLVPRDETSAGSELGRRLAGRDDAPTAVLAADARLAAELVRGLRGEGAEVPGDLSIMCFDDIDGGAPGGIRISGVAHDAPRRSRLTADALFAGTASGTLTVGIVVVERASVGVPAVR